METPKPFFFIFIFIFFLLLLNNASSVVNAQVEETAAKLIGDAMEMPMAMPFYDAQEEEVELDGEDSGAGAGAASRRSLFWRTMRYYISYAALSANRIPCPPRSGRSYYTHNCHVATGPVRPYIRGCSAITRCRR